MKMKLKDILMLNDVLKLIIDNDKELKIDVLFKFKLLGIMKSLENPVTSFNIIKNEKIREYGNVDENGNASISQKDYESIKKFTDDLDKVLNSDVDISIEKIKAEDIFSLGISAEELVKLYIIMEE